MAPDSQMTTVAEHSSDTRSASVAWLLQCTDCEVTWRDHEGAPCWSCGEAGVVANPDRLVVD